MTDPRYPVGRFVPPEQTTEAQVQDWTAEIAALPAKLRQAVDGLSDAQLDTPYREGGWTVRQVVHHLADSHINSFCRFKLALTEEKPEIKPFEEADWAETAEAKSAPVESSLSLLEGLHARWTLLLNSLTPEQFARAVRHPQHGTMSVVLLTALYAWHSRHHLAHITTLREARDW